MRALDRGTVVATLAPTEAAMMKRILFVGSILGALVAPAVGAKPNAPAMVKGDDFGVGQRRIQRDFTVTLSNACVYHANVTGTVDGVREHGSRTVQLVPDLHVEATLECPREKPVRVSGHVGKARLTSAELDEVLLGAMSVPTGGCFYVPDLQGKGLDLRAASLSWMCPSPPASIGGGPQSKTTKAPKATKPKAKAKTTK
jgi:hypothetical protein